MDDLAGRLAWQPLTPGDTEDWTALERAIEDADAAPREASSEHLRERFTHPNTDFTRGSVAVRRGPQLVGYGWIEWRTTADPAHEPWTLGGVHPDHRGLGIGGALLDRLEHSAITLHQELHPGKPLIVHNRCLAANKAALDLFHAHGYHEGRRFLAMNRDLTASLPDLPPPAGVEVLPLGSREQAEDARQVCNDAFRDHWRATPATATYWQHLTGGDRFRADASFVAYDRTGPVGALLSATRPGVPGDLEILLVGTRAPARGRGIASHLVSLAVRRARASGCDTASLGVDSASPTQAHLLYEQLGFRTRAVWIVQLKALHPNA